ncbi:hypothetical protein F441_10927 [Phytophthora nicotianae CJ01A1]|uniref:Uncharacterized protein n=1 Tax=Phytophthora nicotianae CJ01A1 TaxID=1317063 RepID=W2WU87_PHYNI|nr:hypothetical protein F441_10927 [Phytophthora nicotianae CJ01A1]
MSEVPRGQKLRHEGTNTVRKRRRVRTGSEEAPTETASSLGGVAVFNGERRHDGEEGAEYLLGDMAVLRYIAKTRLEVGAEEGTNAANVHESGKCGDLEEGAAPGEAAEVGRAGAVDAGVPAAGAGAARGARGGRGARVGRGASRATRGGSAEGAAMLGRLMSAVPVPWVLALRWPAPVARAEREEGVGSAEIVEPKKAVEPEKGEKLEEGVVSHERRTLLALKVAAVPLVLST